MDIKDFILAIKNKKNKQKDIAKLYAKHPYCLNEWGIINHAIIDRWSRSGLRRIQTLAWRLNGY